MNKSLTQIIIKPKIQKKKKTSRNVEKTEWNFPMVTIFDIHSQKNGAYTNIHVANRKGVQTQWMWPNNRNETRRKL